MWAALFCIRIQPWKKLTRIWPEPVFRTTQSNMFFNASLAAHTKIYIPYLMKTAQIKLLKGSTELYRGHDPAEWDSFGGQNRLLKESTELCWGQDTAEWAGQRISDYYIKESTELCWGQDTAEWDSFGGQNRLLKESTELCWGQDTAEWAGQRKSDYKEDHQNLAESWTPRSGTPWWSGKNISCRLLKLSTELAESWTPRRAGQSIWDE